MHYDCDTPGSHFSEFARDVSESNLEVGGTIQLIEERPLRNSNPVANVFFSNEPRKAAIALRFIAYPEKKKVISIIVWSDERPAESATLAEIPKTGEAISFAMKLENNQLNVVIAGQSFSMPVKPTKIQQISLSCSSGQFKFRNIDIKESK